MPLERPIIIIIIGAGRSGTNMLRDILARLPGFATWPCDEINYIWRHGHVGHPTDTFPAEFATPRVCKFVQKQFQWVEERYEANVVVEKTCANSLRVPFVNTIFPDCRFIHIVRDGRDVAVSAAERWKAPLDLGYILKKARFVPPSDLPFYAARYAWMRLAKVLSRDKRIKSWGPRFEGIDEVYQNNPLPVACAIQWQACVEKASHDLAELPQERVLTLRYEDITHEPISMINTVSAFLQIKISQEQNVHLTSNIRKTSVGRWKQKLSQSDITAIHQAIAPTLHSLNYP